MVAAHLCIFPVSIQHRIETFLHDTRVFFLIHFVIKHEMKRIKRKPLLLAEKMDLYFLCVEFLLLLLLSLLLCIIIVIDTVVRFEMRRCEVCLIFTSLLTRSWKKGIASKKKSKDYECKEKERERNDIFHIHLWMKVLANKTVTCTLSEIESPRKKMCAPKKETKGNIF